MLDRIRHKIDTLARSIGFAWRALKHIPADANAYATHFKTEEQLTTERLARRYDPAQALNEAYLRAEQAVKTGTLPQAPLSTPPPSDPAINEHYESLRRNPPLLTPQQRAAMAVQQRTLQNNLKRLT